MTVNRLRRWPNTNPSLGLLYTLRKHVDFTQCCFNDDPQSSTLARHLNSIVWLYRVFWLLHCYTGDGARNIRKHDTLALCWCNAGPPSATLGQSYSNRKPLSANYFIYSWMHFLEHFLKIKVPNVGTSNVIFDMFRLVYRNVNRFPHTAPLFPRNRTQAKQTL